MPIESKLKQIEQLVKEIREELVAGVKIKPPPTKAPGWFVDGLKKVPMGKSHKTTRLYEQLKPTQEELEGLRLSGTYSGEGVVLFGKFVSKMAGEDIDGLTLIRGMVDGCTAYRIVPTGALSCN